MDHISRVGLFLAVVKHQSFAGAARSLGLTGPALSKQVQALEDQLGVKLLHRTTRLVTLTEAGAAYSERARKALEDLEEAERYAQALKNHPIGVLKVNAPIFVSEKYLAQPIAEFAKKYPDVTMQVDFEDRRVDVVGEGYDVVLRIGVLQDSSLIARKLADCPVILCASPEFMKEHGQFTSPEQVSGLPAIVHTQHGIADEWFFRSIKGRDGSVRLMNKFGANNAAMMLEACLKGVGLGMLPVFSAAPHLRSGALVRVLPEYSTHPVRGFYAIFPQNRHMSAKVRLFIDWLTEHCKELPW